MTDLHTHILPGMDDGARDVTQSVAMLRMEREQGLKAVVLTPHFYSDRESIEHFLLRRKRSFSELICRLEQLPGEEYKTLPALYLGAEVAWRSELLEKEELPLLCIGQTKNMLVELPFTPWTDGTIKQLYELIVCFGITPVIAHLERYLDRQDPKIIRKLLELDVPIQISCAAFEGFFVRRKVMKLLREGYTCLAASDCHDCTCRPPDMDMALKVIRRKLSEEKVSELVCCADELARGN